MDDGFPSELSRQAGEWGEYKCDLPSKTLKAMFLYIRDVIKPDVLFWTGDNSPHTIWKNDEEEVIAASYNISIMIQDVFGPTTSNITVIPINGNHDMFPANNQDFTKGEGMSEFVSYGKLWKDMGWLSEQEQMQYKKYGFYSKNFTLKNGKQYPNTRIIAINTMSCYIWNFELLKARYDPGEQIAWLEKELASLEAVNGKAIIIGHIAPIYAECIHSWSVRYNALIERYQHIIRFGMFGHDHTEQIQLINSPKNNQ